MFTVSGNMGQIQPLLQKMRFQGRWQQHAKHGLQLRCTGSQLLQSNPASRALAEISGQISGVGKHTARCLIEAFGEDVIKVKLVTGLAHSAWTQAIAQEFFLGAMH